MLPIVKLPPRRSEIQAGTVFRYLKNDGTQIPHNHCVYVAEKRHFSQPTMVAGEKPELSDPGLTSKSWDRFVEILWMPRS